MLIAIKAFVSDNLGLYNILSEKIPVRVGKNLAIWDFVATNFFRLFAEISSFRLIDESKL